MRTISKLCLVISFLLWMPLYAAAQEVIEPADHAESVDAQNETGDEIIISEDVGDGVDLSDFEIVKPSRTTRDNIGGANLGVQILLGTSPYDPMDEIDESAKVWWFLSGAAELDFSYLFGEDVFIGPRVSVSINSPYLLSFDMSVKTAVPISRQDAFTTSLGLGYSLTSFLAGTFSPWSEIIAVKYISPNKEFEDDTVPGDVYGLYFPIQVGYEHVFENGFTLGATVEMKVGFKSNTIRYFSVMNTPETGAFMYYRGDRDKLGLTVNFIGAGVYLGYSFRDML